MALSEALELVAEGRPLAEGRIDSLTTQMGAFQAAYNDLRDCALELLNSAELTNDASGFQYIDLIEISEAEAVKSRFESLLATLNDFLRIEADGEDYDRAIDPYRQEAREALEFLNSLDTYAVPGDIEESCEPKRLLVEAINLEDFDSQEGEELLNALGPIYPWKVHQGLMLRKYHLAQDVLSTEGAGGLNAQIIETDAHDESRDDESLPGIVSANEDASSGSTPQKEDGLKTVDEESDVSNEELLLPVSGAKPAGKVSAASFKKDLLQNAPSSVRILLPEIVVCTFIGAGQLGELFEYMSGGLYTSDEMLSGIQYLRRKGLLTLFDTRDCDLPEDYAYTLSSYACALLEKESIRNLKLGKDAYWKFSIEKGSCSSFDDGLPVTLLKKRSERIQQLIGCYVMTTAEDEDVRLGRISSITFENDNLWIRAEKDGQQKRFAIIGEGEEPPEEAEYAITVTPIAEPEDDALAEEQQSTDERRTAGGQEPTAANTEEEDESPVDASEEPLVEAAPTDEQDGQTTVVEDTPIADPNTYHETTTPSDEDVDEGDVEETEDGQKLSHEENSDDDTIESYPNAQMATDAIVTPEARDTGKEDASPNLEPTGIERLLNGGSAKTCTQPTDEGFVELAAYMVNHPEESQGSRAHGAIASALALLESGALIEGYDLTKERLHQLRLATGTKGKGDEYTGSTLSRTFGEFSSVNESLILSAYCRALFDPKNPYDYQLWNTCEPLVTQYGDSFPSYPELRPLLSKLLEIHDASPAKGFNERVLDTLSDRVDRSIKLEAMKRNAETLLQKPTFKAMIHGMPEFNEACFGKESDLSFCMTTIKNDDRSDLELVRGILSDYLDTSGQIDDDAIGERIDSTWRAAVANKNTKGIRKPEFYARRQAVEAFVSRLNLMDEWVSYVEGSADDKSTSKLGEIRKDLIEILRDCSESLRAVEDPRRGQEVVLFMLDSLLMRLTGDEESSSLFDDFLLTGYVSLKDNGLPNIEPTHNSIKYFEPWRRVLLHWLEEKPSLEDAADAICRDGMPSSDNLRQLSNIEKLLGHSATEVPREEMLTRARSIAEHDGDKFFERLEVAYAFGEIDESQKELLQGLLASNKESLFESEEFGLWRQLISALNKQIVDMSASQGRQLAARLERCERTLRGKPHCDLLTQARVQLTETRNFAVVEEYLNRFEAGERKLPESYSEEDSFAEFISNEVYGPLQEACQRGRSQQFTRFAKQYVHDRYPAGWSNRHKESSEKLIANWPCSGKKKAEPSTIAQLFRQFGLSIKGAWKSDFGSEHYMLDVRSEKRNRSDYAHPIAMFGTQARSPLDVIVLHGNQSAKEIVNQVSSARVNGMSVVIVDGCLSLQTRRQVAEIFHTSKSKISPFLLIDQVLTLHLALHEETERLPILLKCTLPFTYYQPFNRDGGATPDEMFSGRESELRTIIDPRGATVVYGGRQLGKTALLERAEGLQHDPDNGRYAVLANVQQCASEEGFVRQVIRAFGQKTSLELSAVDTIEELSDELRKLLDQEDVRFILLLIDEADCFLDSISDRDYMPIKPLVDLKRDRPNEFKFVLAGLHNVVRYKNATANNGIFGQLGSPLCVKPLKPADALRLMSRPLGYLGFDVKRYPHIETILTNTNYYPGILQFFGYELVDTMTKQYGQYYQASLGHPPYGLTQEQLGSIMSSRRLNSSIKDKFLLSLQLDSRYMALARCVALLTQEREGDTASELSGLSASEVLECGKSWDVKALVNETVKTTEILMDEMVDMGILSKGDADSGGYRLRMHRFLSIIGSIDAILEAFVTDEED